MHIIGAGGHAKVVIDILTANNLSISGIWDDNEDLEFFLGSRLSGKIMSFKDLDNDFAVLAIGNNKIRKRLSKQLNAKFGTLFHPSSVISPSALVLEGTVVMPNVTVNSSVTIGKHVILNTGSSVDHDCKIDDFVHISPQVALAGDVEVGEGTHIGIGACVIPGIKIGKWAAIGAGAVVISNIPDYAVVVGNPGRIIKYNPI